MRKQVVYRFIPSIMFLAFASGCDSGETGSGLDGGGLGEVGAPLEGVLVDDFDDGDNQAAPPGGAWFQYDDESNGGKSALTFAGVTDGSIAMNGKGYESSRSLEVTYTFDQGTLTYSPYVGFGVWFADKGAPMDVTPYLGVGYTYRGGAHRIRIETFEVTDWDFLGMDMPASVDWTTVVVPFTQLRQEGFGVKMTFNPANLGNVSFQMRGATGTQGKLSIDTLKFLTKLPNQEPDMVVRPAEPPAEIPIDSLVISNPLQAKARTYLNRGYNITNWLEEERFTGFTYDEAYVTKLANAGFKSLRLPIDLDRYIISTSGSGETLDGEVHEDLFKVLDAFADWTAKAGLSLTIDFHQYDKSIDKSKPETIERAVLAWKKVAAHFANNPREDLFYELLNEPELSFAGTPPTQAEWTAMAEQMITAIRASDKTHTIIFGDVEWYGISRLAARKPLSDGNVIYAFHTYEPFVFTHQGASWVTMSSTHGIPYPYSADRWSEFSTDLGFNLTMEPWILSAANNYFRTGNRSAIRNQILNAKRWAIANNVPVICNEFGAYDRSSTLEDRARYLTDVVSIFEELEIPWQQWFLVMDRDGIVIPEYRAAMRLDL